MHFAGLIARYPQITVRNLSDGIRIPGAVPCLPEAAALEADVSRKTRDLERLRSELDEAAPDELVPPERLDILMEALDLFYLSIETVISGVDPSNADLRKLFDDLKALLDNPTQSDADICVQRMHLGTLMVCYTFLYRAYRRLPQDARAPFLAFFQQRMAALLADMRRDSTNLTRELRDLAAA